MAATTVFDWVSAQLEEATPLSGLEARGTVRIALKSAGLEARAVTRAQMDVVLTQVMPGELVARAVEGAEGICTQIARDLKDADVADEGGGDSSPEEVFRRLAKG